MTNLPDDVMMEILLRLPVKTLLRFRCLSKSYCSLIFDPCFIKLHLHQSLQSCNHKIAFREKSLEYSITDAAQLLDGLISGDPARITLPFENIRKQCPLLYNSTSCQILCSCNGLLLLGCYLPGRNRKHSIVVWNPSTRKYRELVTPADGTLLYCTYGFGYDSSTDDYKGAVHWVQLKQKKIFYFSLAEEIFQEMALPDDAPDINPQLDVLKGCLCVSEFKKTVRDGEYDTCSMSIWLMKEYGVATSWTKLVTIPPLPFRVPLYSISALSEAFCCIKNNVVFVIRPFFRDSRYLLYHIETKETKIVDISSQDYHLKTDLTFVESLVSPNL